MRELHEGILSPSLFVVSFIRTAQLEKEGGWRKEEDEGFYVQLCDNVRRVANIRSKPWSRLHPPGSEE